MDLHKQLYHYFRRKPFDLILLTMFVAVIIKLFSLYFSAGIDDGEWDAFKIQHNCKMQLKKRGLPHTIWECDDGKLYYRWRQQR